MHGIVRLHVPALAGWQGECGDHQPTMARYGATASSAKLRVPQASVCLLHNHLSPPLCSSLPPCNCFLQPPPCGPQSLPRRCPRRRLLPAVLPSRQSSQNSQNQKMNTTTSFGRTQKSRTGRGEWPLSRHTQRYNGPLITPMALC